MLIGNKGEWSEIYAFLKLLADKKIYSGDADLNKNEYLYYPIEKIIRNENGVKYEYAVVGDTIVISYGTEQKKILTSEFEKFAHLLLEHISNSGTTFSVQEVESFLDYINCRTLKAKSNSKSDIFIVIYDKRTNTTHELGFSIKSELGAGSTLLNASQPTNFTYKINNFSPQQSQLDSINRIDTKSKIKDKIEAIKNIDGFLEFFSIENLVFKNNLVLIDSLLPNILSEIIIVFFTSKLKTLSELTSNINKKNPLNYDQDSSHKFYEYKIKKFLTDVALGMTPSKVWTGVYDATGGYLIVKETGEVLCYHIYNQNQFEDYLFNNTKLETASSTRHEFGKIYEEAGQYFFKLNLQIRFI